MEHRTYIVAANKVFSIFIFLYYSDQTSHLTKHNGSVYVARKPPSTGRVTPFTMAALSLSRKRMQCTTSSTSANLMQDS